MNIIYGKTTCSPEEVQFNGERLPVLYRHFEKLMAENKILGASFCLSRYGKIFAHGAMGYRSFKKEETALIQPDTVFSIASITKVFTAVAIMQLVEDGLVRLDTPVKEILPQFNVKTFDTIDLFHLLTHTSGMYPDCEDWATPNFVQYWDYIDQYIDQYKPEQGEFDWIKASLKGGAKCAPGKEWQYCSFGFAILGAVIQKLTGINAHQYIEDHIAKPLSMNDTLFEPTTDQKRRHMIKSVQDEEYASQEDNSFIPYSWDEIPGTGGELHSTPEDLIKFGNAMLFHGTSQDGVRILGRKALEKITTRALYNIPDYCWGGNNPDRSYGIGFDMRTGWGFTYSPTTFHHEGAGACSLIIDPTEQLVATWFVPFVGDEWHAEALHNVQNIIWSGLL